MRAVAVAAALVFLVAIVTAGVMQSDGTTTAASRTTQLVDDAAKTRDQKTATLTLTVSSPEYTRTVRATGIEDFRHDAVDLNFGKVEEIVVGPHAYLRSSTLTLPAGKRWLSLPIGPTPATQPTYLSDALKTATSAKIVGHPKLNGTKTTEYEVAGVNIGHAPILGVTGPTINQVLHVWVDDSDHVRQFQIDLRVGPAVVSFVAGYSDFGTKANITAPPADQVIPASAVPAALPRIRAALGGTR